MIHWKSAFAGALFLGLPLGVGLMVVWHLKTDSTTIGPSQEMSVSGLMDGESGSDPEDLPEDQSNTKAPLLDEDTVKKLRQDLLTSVREEMREEVREQVEELGDRWKNFMFSPHDDRFFSSLLELRADQLESFVETRNSIQQARAAVLYQTLARESYDPELFRELMKAIRSEELQEMAVILDGDQFKTYSQWTGEAGMEFFPGRVVQVEIEDLINEQVAEMAQDILRGSQYDQLESDPVDVSSDPGEFLQIPIRTRPSNQGIDPDVQNEN